MRYSTLKTGPESTVLLMFHFPYILKIRSLFFMDCDSRSGDKF